MRSSTTRHLLVGFGVLCEWLHVANLGALTFAAQAALRIRRQAVQHYHVNERKLFASCYYLWQTLHIFQLLLLVKPPTKHGFATCQLTTTPMRTLQLRVKANFVVWVEAC